MPHPDNEHLKAIFKRSKEENAALAKSLLKEKYHTGKLVTNIKSRLILSLWIGGILLAGFIIFVITNTVGKSLLGLEQSLEHHRSYHMPAESDKSEVSTHDGNESIQIEESE